MDTPRNDFILRTVILAMWITGVTSIKQDVCLWNTFDATCGDNEVIQMEHAYYGRMTVGSCIPHNAGYEMGCHDDVLSYLDYVCSGRQSCQLRLPDYLTTGPQPCSRGFESYLQLQYSCIAVHISLTPCAGDPLAVSEKQGLLSNVITELTSQGSSECPWAVRGSPGQKVRLTLHDYGVWTAPTTKEGGSEESVRSQGTSDTCHIYARVTEDSTMRSVTLCGGESREKIVYLSETANLQIALTNPKHTQHAAYFLLQYEVVGCPEFLPPEGAVVERYENDVSVKCPGTGSEWLLSCDGTRWASAEKITNCTGSEGPPVTINTLVNSFLTLPQWILILMILAVGVIIAVPIIVIGCVSLRRKHDDVIAPPPTLQMDAGKCIEDHFVKERDPMLAKSETLQTSPRGREYTTTAHRKLCARAHGQGIPLPLPPTPPMSDAENCIVHGTLGHKQQRDSRHSTFKPTYTEHKYESPIPLRRTLSENENADTCYNQLDRDQTYVQARTPPHEPSESDTDSLNPGH